MKKRNFIGIDIGSETLACSILQDPEKAPVNLEEIENNQKGFGHLIQWFKKHQVGPQNSIICMEATGVYGEQLCYFLYAQGFKIAVDHPLKIKRAFSMSGPKNDPVDSKQIAEYAYRFFDELKYWKPKVEVLERINVLLSVREQFVTQRTANSNSLKALKRKAIPVKTAEKLFERNIEDLSKNIAGIKEEIKNLISENPTFKKYHDLLRSIPGIGLLFTSHMLVITDGFSKTLSARTICQYMRIAPNERKSGKTLNKKARSGMRGPSRLRKLIHLAARSARTHNKQFKYYFLRKEAEGKEKRVVINNIANKLIKVVCAVVEKEQPFIPNFRSVSPILLKNV